MGEVEIAVGRRAEGAPSHRHGCVEGRLGRRAVRPEHGLQAVIGDAVGVQCEIHGDLHRLAAFDRRCSDDVDVTEDTELEVGIGFMKRAGVSSRGRMGSVDVSVSVGFLFELGG